MKDRAFVWRLFKNRRFHDVHSFGTSSLCFYNTLVGLELLYTKLLSFELNTRVQKVLRKQVALVRYSNLLKNKPNHNLTLRMKDHQNIDLGTLPFWNINDFRLQKYTHRTDVFRDMQKFQMYSEFFHAQK